MKIETREQLITPEQAGEWLDAHYERLGKGKFSQRPVSSSVVNKYATDILNGNWLLCPSPIVFDEAGNLLDGQHRLEGVRKAKLAVPMLVSTGWPASKANNGVGTMDVIDRGRGRTVGQQLHIHGYPNATNYASAVNVIVRICWARSAYASVPAALYILDQLDLRRHIDRIVSKSEVSTRDFKPRTVGPLAFYHTVSPRKAEEFADAIFNFTGEKGSPPQLYLQWVKNKRASDDHFKGFCACLLAWEENRNIQAVRLTIENVKAVAGLNPKLRDQIKKITAQSGSRPMN